MLGVVLLLWARGQRSTTAGVTLSAIAVVPLLVYLFVDVNEPSNTIDDPGDFTSTATLILLAAAALWLLAYFVGPGRRYGFFLGAALVAIWLVGVVQIADDPLNQVEAPGWGTTTTFEPIPMDDDFGSFQDDDFGTFDDDFGSFQDDDFGRYQEPDDPSTRLGVLSLVFGGAYLALGAWRDRRGDLRQATPLFAVAAPILTLATSFLSSSLDAEGTAVLAIALGCTAVWLGVSTGRRFTAWYGTFAAVVGTIALVISIVEDHQAAQGVVMLVIGLGLAVAATAMSGGLPPLGRGGPSTPFTPQPGPQAWTMPTTPPVGAPQAPPGGQAWTPPTNQQQPPAPQGWTPPATPPQPPAAPDAWAPRPGASDPWAPPAQPSNPTPPAAPDRAATDDQPPG